MAKPSPHQLAMLKMFAKGWRFKLYGNTAGTWRTYWALRNKGWCNCRGAADVLTPAGKAILAKYAEKEQG